MEYIIIGGGIVLLLVVIYVSKFNKIRTYGVKIDEAFSNIDVALSKRYHTLTQLLEVAKGYAKHERETLLEVIKLRKGMSIVEKERVTEQINQGYQQIALLSESYPNLKADTVFINLQNAASDAEEHLQAARRLYNSNVSLYNQAIQTFPGNIIAGSMDVSSRQMYQASSEERDNVNLNI